MLRLLTFALFAYVVVVFLAYLFQRNLQYFPWRQDLPSPAEAGLPQMQAVQVKTEDGLDLTGWFSPPRTAEGKIVIFFHGNGGYMAHRATKAIWFIEHGYGVFLAEYRGYGGNPGKPTEEGFYRDGRAVIKFLEKNGFNTGQFVLYGESIGTGVAVHLAREIQSPALILEAPFASAVDVARLHYFWLPVEYLMKDRYDSILKIKDIKSSLLIIHGDEDRVIPISQAAKLYAAANHPKEFVSINGGGHNVYEHHAGHIITEWLGKQAR